MNKVNTKATLRLPADESAWIPPFIIRQLHGSQYLTKHGDIVIQSQRSRTQEDNKEDCFRKLADIIFDTGNANIAGETSEATRSKVGKMIRKDNQRRLDTKKQHSAKKSSRRIKES